MKTIQSVLAFLLLTAGTESVAQPGINQFFTTADSFSQPRSLLLTGGIAAGYAGAILLLDQAWYADYPKSSFHFFNDNQEWLQMDKAGHAYSAYFQSAWSTRAFRWAGVKEKKSAVVGAATGFLIQTSIELLDGYCQAWGASPGDVLANFAGSALFISQEMAWGEQRVLLKFSSAPQQYPAAVNWRAQELFGTTLGEKTLKDYNAQTYWLSVNPSAFVSRDANRFPRWLNVAFGYGAQGMLGARTNDYAQNGATDSALPINRQRQFYLSPDVDFARINTQSPVLKTFFFLLNIVKIPAPALEIDSGGSWTFHALHF
jgi:hypothetical protein